MLIVMEIQKLHLRNILTNVDLSKRQSNQTARSVLLTNQQPRDSMRPKDMLATPLVKWTDVSTVLTKLPVPLSHSQTSKVDDTHK